MSDTRSTDHILYHLGEDHQAWSGAMVPPIYQTANFHFESVAAMREAFGDETRAHLYSRGNNPTVDLLRQKIAALEGTESALVFGSGMAAISAALLSQLSAGDHVVCVRDPYPWVRFLMERWLPRFDIDHTYVDGLDPQEFTEAMRPETRIFYLESPNTFTYSLQDLPAVAAIAREHGLRTLIDNSHAGPLNQQPAALGIDIVLHSASKYLGGHGDVVAGVLCASSAIVREIFVSEFQGLGGILSPYDAWLLIRGLRTLPLRMDRVADNADRIVRHLVGQSWIRRVLYPFHPTHPQYELARRQMRAGSGQFSFELDIDDASRAERFCDALQLFQLAVSWGGFESLVVPACARADSTLPAGLVRACAGLEDASALISDLEQAAVQAGLT